MNFEKFKNFMQGESDIKKRLYLSTFMTGNVKWLLMGLPFLGVRFNEMITLRDCFSPDDDEDFSEFKDKICLMAGIPFESALKCCVSLNGRLVENSQPCRCTFKDFVESLTSLNSFNTSVKCHDLPFTAVYVFDVKDEYKEEFYNIKTKSLEEYRSLITEDHKKRIAYTFAHCPKGFSDFITKALGFNFEKYLEVANENYKPKELDVQVSHRFYKSDD